jgi:hypothetical protein
VFRIGDRASQQAGGRIATCLLEGASMFEALEHEKTPEEKKLLTLEVIVAVIACALIGGAVFWFFSAFGEY